MKNIAVIGAGTMGNGIAHVFAQHGFAVTLIDVQAAQLEKAIAKVKKSMEKAAKDLDFMEAARLRDQMFAMKDKLEKMQASSR